MAPNFSSLNWFHVSLHKETLLEKSFIRNNIALLKIICCSFLQSLMIQPHSNPDCFQCELSFCIMEYSGSLTCINAQFLTKQETKLRTHLSTFTYLTTANTFAKVTSLQLHSLQFYVSHSELCFCLYYHAIITRRKRNQSCFHWKDKTFIICTSFTWKKEGENINHFPLSDVSIRGLQETLHTNFQPRYRITLYVSC